MQTLIKWPGGKTREFNCIRNLLPSFNRYIEPFFGGGAIYFQLKPQEAVINDICVELIEFYKYIKGENNREEFKKELYAYAENWDKIPKYLELFENEIIDLYKQYRLNKIDISTLKEIVGRTLEKDEARFNGMFLKSFCLDEKNLLNRIISNIISKIKRMRDIEKQKGKLVEEDLSKNIETAFRSGFYMHFRDVMNYNEGKFHKSNAKKIANYYFIREFCYGSMFRFNSSGHFNIPYGGIAYNRKDFKGKINYIFSEEVENIFRNTEIKNTDFINILTKYSLSKKDFIFLDPPYDTDFSNYEKKNFDRNDQERLANSLYKIKARFLLIIKNTPFIYNLYKNKKGVNINKFDKKYLYNVKGRNDRNVEHLVVYNY